MSNPAQKTKNRYAQYMGPLLDALRALGDSANRLEAADKVVEIMGLSAEEADKRYEKTGRRIVQNNIEWAASGLRFFEFVGGQPPKGGLDHWPHSVPGGMDAARVRGQVTGQDRPYDDP